MHIPSPAISMLRTALSRRRHFIRIQTAEVNATKRLLRGVGWPGGTRMTLRSAGSWDRLAAALAATPDLQSHVYALLRDRSEFQPTRLGVEEGPFTQTVTRHYRLTPKSAERLVTA